MMRTGLALALVVSVGLAGRADAASLDVRARIPTWRVGPLTLRAITVTARSSGTLVRACFTARVVTPDATVTGCTAVPWASVPTLRAAEVRWHARARSGAAWTAKGRARVAWSGRDVRVERASVEASAANLALGALRLSDVQLAATITGTRAGLAITGRTRAARVATTGGASVELARAELPFELRAQPGRELALVATHALAVRAATASVELAGERAIATRPRFVLHPDGPLVLAPPETIAWDATSLRWHGLELVAPSGTLAGTEQRVTWTRADGPGPLELGAGSLALRDGRITSGTAAVLGGRVDVVARAAAGEVVLAARGLALPRLLATVADRVDATGVLDGHLVLDGASVRSLALRARGPGTLLVRDPELRARWAHADREHLHTRIPGALADFAYERLTVALSPRGTSPDLRVALHGRGRTVPQVVDLVINLRGVRDAVQRFTRRAAR